MISSILLIIFVVLSYLYSLWFIIGVVALGVFKFGHWRHYSSRPWRKVHFPMMLDYASAAGLERRQADIDGREFDFNLALLHLLNIIGLKVNISHDEFIQREYRRFEDFYDKQLIRQYLVDKQGVDKNKAEQYLEEIESAITWDRGFMVKMIVASVIEEKYSQMDRGEYMFEVFRGAAN